jgi:redox-sensitive bicupin YhaK (pirin superfamily)
MKYGIDVSDGHQVVYQFATENEHVAWIAVAEGRSAISGTSREVKRALYHGEVFEITREREKEITTTEQNAL